MAWTGFTDEQLMQLKTQTDEPTEEDHLKNNQTRRPQHAKIGAPRRTQANRNAAQRGRGPRPATNPTQHSDNLSPNQMLSRPKEVPNRPRPQQQRPQQRPRPSGDHGDGVSPSEQRTRNAKIRPDGVTDSVTKSGVQDGRRHPDSGGGGGNSQVVTQLDNEVENKEVICEEIDEKEGISRELTKMERFQEEQKKIEGENAQRKALLGRAIADRKKKTQAETKRLVYIQKELSKIEGLLTNDVRILRDRIEEACRTYSEAQKRYQKAEEEFVAAKLHLHKTEDLKESLTEHLYTIIHENEVRKSKKLEDLVNKLEVDNLDEYEQQLIEESKPQTPTSPSFIHSSIQFPIAKESEKSQQLIEESKPRTPTSPTGKESETSVVIQAGDENQQQLSSKKNSTAVTSTDQIVKDKQSNSESTIITTQQPSGVGGPDLSKTAQSEVTDVNILTSQGAGDDKVVTSSSVVQDSEKGDLNPSPEQRKESIQEVPSTEDNAPSSVS